MCRLSERCCIPMPDAGDEARELLRRASSQPRHTTQRKLLVAAAFSRVALEDAVVVGGVAVELHTHSYRPTDIDVVGYRKRGHSRSLSELGFQKEGRHWLYSFDDGETLAVEVPSDRLDDFAVEPPLTVSLNPGEVAVIALNDLMMDRLLQATGGEPVTYDEAVRLAVAAYQRIAWTGLEERAMAAADEGSPAGRALPKILARVRREAKRLLRKQAGEASTTSR
jgi:hypothetical protein